MVTEPVGLVDLLQPGLAANPDAPAVVSADTHWTWRELDARTDRVAQELIRFARKEVGYKAPEEIVALDEFPLTATGKVDRALLVRMAEPAHH